MKKFILSSLAFGLLALSHAQEVDKQDWFHANYAETGVHGVGTNAAIDFLKAQGIKPKPIIVAVIDSGIEIDHEDLKDNIWVNPKEIAGNGKDDDKNGYVDDINGWDFIGGADGKDVDKDTYEFVRVYAKYDPVFNSDDLEKNRTNAMKMPKVYEKYLKARNEYFENYNEAKSSVENNGEISEQQKEILTFLKDLKAFYGDGEINDEGVAKLTPTNGDEEELLGRLKQILQNNPSVKGQTFEEIITEFAESMDGSSGRANDQLDYYYNKDFNTRLIVGDNYENKTEKFYGNNEVEGPDAMHGTHVAGIIAAVRNNNIGMDGVAGDVAKIMVLRAVPDGDERDKDVANAIRYAVDNGAKIINMSFGKSYSPFKEVVWDAMKYANAKGVLMFHAAGNSNKDLDYRANYPTNYKQYEYTPIVENWITVGASTRYNENLKSSFSNYGLLRVDLFAPGSEIYATVTDGGYRYLQGTSMASPVAAGCAALLWSHFPKLKAKQVKNILMESVNKSTAINKVSSSGIDLEFNKLSKSGGTIDVNKAVRLAYEKYK